MAAITSVPASATVTVPPPANPPCGQLSVPATPTAPVPWRRPLRVRSVTLTGVAWKSAVPTTVRVCPTPVTVPVKSVRPWFTYVVPVTL